MKQFKILDNNNNPVAILELDRIAATFWGKETDKDRYANPYKGTDETSKAMTPNWFDIVGWAIATSGKRDVEEWEMEKKGEGRVKDEARRSRWHRIAEQVLSNLSFTSFISQDLTLTSFTSGKPYTITPELKFSIEFQLSLYGEFLALISHFYKLGFTPVKVD